MKKPQRTAWRAFRRGWSKEDVKRLSSWCWSRSRVASLHCPLSSPTVLFRWVTYSDLHPCHIAWRCMIPISLFHELKILLIRELDLNRFHGFSLLLRNWLIDCPFFFASSFKVWAVFLSVLKLKSSCRGFCFFLPSIIQISIFLRDCSLTEFRDLGLNNFHFGSFAPTSRVGQAKNSVLCFIRNCTRFG